MHFCARSGDGFEFLDLPRIEQFVVEFATAVDGPVRQAQVAARAAWFDWNTIHEWAAEQSDGVDTEGDAFKDMNKRTRAAFKDALAAWEETAKRLDWLAKRIAGRQAVEDDALGPFALNWMRYSFEAIRWNAWGDKPVGDASAWTNADAVYRNLVASVETLSLRIGPPATAVQRWRAHRRRSRAQAFADRRGTESGM